MGEETILKKVNDRLYIKPCKRKDGTDFDIKWEKELEPMWLDLTDIKLCHEFSVEHPAFGWQFDISLGRVKAEDKWEWEKYERHEGRSIEASGRLVRITDGSPGDSIGLIAKDGTTKSKVFTQVKLFIRKMAGDFTQADIEGRRVNGHMYYWGFPGADAHVLLDFGIPAENFDNAYRELQEVKHREVSLCIFVDVFNSEVDRGLRDSDMPREFFIEAEWIGNQIFFSKLIISELVSNSPDKEISSEENKPEVTDDANKLPTPIFAAIANNIAQVRVLLIVILILFVLRIFKIL